MIYDWTVTIDGGDVSGLIVEAGTINYGRQGDGVAFAAPWAEFQMFTEAGRPDYAGTWPTLDDGLPVIIHVTWDGITQWRRFTGKIQGLDYRSTRVRVTASGSTVDYQDFPAGETTAYYPRTVEPDTDRVAWLADGAPTALTVEGAPGRRVRMIDRNAPAAPLLEQLLRVADDSDGLLIEDRLGVPRYRSRTFTLPGTYTIPNDIVDWESVTLSKDRGEMLSTVRVRYGEPNPSTGVQAYRTATDSALAIRFGFDKSLDTYSDLRTPEAADGRAAQLLARHGNHYTMPDVVLVMSEATGPQADDILDLQEGWPVTIEPLPDGWPISSYDGTIIGFSEVMSDTEYMILLRLEPFLEPAAEDDDDPIYPDGIITGYDSTGTETIDDKEYRWCRWDTSGTFTVDYPTAVYTRVVAAGGGGSGGAGLGGLYGSGGAGGAGGFMNEFLDLNPGTWPVTVGTGGAFNSGAAGDSGTDTVIYGTRLYGGGYGGGPGNLDGGDGGSGGGAAYNRDFGEMLGTPGSGVIGQGHDGLYGGGGTGGPPPSGTSYHGGAGVAVEIGGETVTFCAGGKGLSADTKTNPGAGGDGAGGGYGGSAGANGRVYLRYRIG